MNIITEYTLYIFISATSSFVPQPGTYSYIDKCEQAGDKKMQEKTETNKGYICLPKKNNE